MTESMIAGMDLMSCTVVSSHTFSSITLVMADLSFASSLPFAAR